MNRRELFYELGTAITAFTQGCIAVSFLLKHNYFGAGFSLIMGVLSFCVYGMEWEIEE
jgi:hypothetical protein